MILVCLQNVKNFYVYENCGAWSFVPIFFSKLQYTYSFKKLSFRDGPLEKWWGGGWGIFGSQEFFFRSLLMHEFFFRVKPSAQIFFFN